MTEEPRKIRGLAGAAGHLCSAQDELAAAGYKDWSKELRDLIDTIAAEIAWLESDRPPEQ